MGPFPLCVWVQLSWVLCLRSHRLQSRYQLWLRSHLRLRVFFQAIMVVGRIQFLVVVGLRPSASRDYSSPQTVHSIDVYSAGLEEEIIFLMSHFLETVHLIGSVSPGYSPFWLTHSQLIKGLSYQWKVSLPLSCKLIKRVMTPLYSEILPTLKERRVSRVRIPGGRYLGGHLRILPTTVSKLSRVFTPPPNFCTDTYSCLHPWQ